MPWRYILRQPNLDPNKFRSFQAHTREAGIILITRPDSDTIKKGNYRMISPMNRNEKS